MNTGNTAELLHAGQSAGVDRSAGAAQAGRAGRVGLRRRQAEILGARVAPAAAAHERTLPLLDEVAPLFPGGALRRGSTVSITGTGSTGAALAVAAGPSAQGSWLGVVGDRGLGWAAASEIGVDLARVLVVDPEPREWPYAVAALIGSVDLILVAPRRRVPAGDARRLTARARERDSVIVCRGVEWPEGADVQLEVVSGTWQGIGDGHGMLRSRRVQIAGGGRGAASRPRHAELLLPGPQGAPAGLAGSLGAVDGAEIQAAGSAADTGAHAAGSVAVAERGDPDGIRGTARAEARAGA